MIYKLTGINFIQIISIIILFVLIIILLRQSKALKYERRIGPFSLEPAITEESFFDKLFVKLWNLIRKLSKALGKSKVLKKYSKRYEKYITIEEKDFKSGLDYISLKFLFVIGIDLLYLLTLVFQYVSFNYGTFMIASILGFFMPDLYLAYQFNMKRKIVEDDLLKAVIIMNSAFKSGSNIVQAVEIVMNELEGPIKDEFKKIYMDINYGLSLEVVFKRFYERVKLEDAKYLTSSLSLLNKTGGNIVKVFSVVEKSFFDKKKLRNELKSLSAPSVFVFRFLLLLPIFFIAIIMLFNPTYFNPLIEHSIGMIVIFIVLLLYIIYFLVVRKLLRVRI